MTDFATFNVGGTLYKVSRSLLKSHPDTMLAKSASKQWQEDPESEIFMERDGARFRHVLDYMRDSKVVLPVTESREALIAELHYYGIEVDEEATRTHLEQLQALKSKSELERRCLQAAIGCLSYYLTKCTTDTNLSKVFKFHSSNDAYDKENLNKLFKHRDPNGEKMEKVNSLLEPVGLSITMVGILSITMVGISCYQQTYFNVKVIDPTVRKGHSSSITSSNT